MDMRGVGGTIVAHSGDNLSDVNLVTQPDREVGKVRQHDDDTVGLPELQQTSRGFTLDAGFVHFVIVQNPDDFASNRRKNIGPPGIPIFVGLSIGFVEATKTAVFSGRVSKNLAVCAKRIAGDCFFAGNMFSTNVRLAKKRMQHNAFDWSCWLHRNGWHNECTDWLCVRVSKCHC